MLLVWRANKRRDGKEGRQKDRANERPEEQRQKGKGVGKGKL